MWLLLLEQFSGYRQLGTQLIYNFFYAFWDLSWQLSQLLWYWQAVHYNYLIIGNGIRITTRKNLQTLHSWSFHYFVVESNLHWKRHWIPMQFMWHSMVIEYYEFESIDSPHLDLFQKPSCQISFIGCWVEIK